jgi:hypothetical protein
MTKEQINISIAEACGWKDIVRTVDHRRELVGNNTNKMRIMHRGEYLDNCSRVPDYFNDLNAMHEAEMVLKDRGLQVDYWDTLSEMMDDHDHEAISATAAQRCEAFLKTIGKWKEPSEPHKKG